jgi:hypothetical protein
LLQGRNDKHGRLTHTALSLAKDIISENSLGDTLLLNYLKGKGRLFVVCFILAYYFFNFI